MNTCAPHTRPNHRSWSRPSNRLLNLIKERLRTMSQDRAAGTFRTSVDTLLTLHGGGTVTPEAVARLERIAADHLKGCKCGRQYTRETWDALPLVGLQDDGEGGQIELRNCACDSTIAVEVAA